MIASFLEAFDVSFTPCPVYFARRKLFSGILMGKGERTHSSFQSPLSTTDILPDGKKREVLYNNSLMNNIPLHEDADLDEQDAPLFVLVTTYLSYFILIVFGHLRDFIGKILYPSAFKHLHIRVPR